MDTNLPQDKILILEDQEAVALMLRDNLANAGSSLADWSQEVRNSMERFPGLEYELVLVDEEMARSKKGLIRNLRTEHPGMSIVVMCQAGDVESAVSFIHEGAFAILEKPFSTEKVAHIVAKARAHAKMLESQKNIVAPTQDMYHGLIGRSSAMQKIFTLIDRIRESSVNILITGPSGAGKEMIAKALHDTSPRAKNKFVAINCSAIPDALLEGELFGYKKGAFTDARTNKLGLFQEAEQGTLFLDEIGDMPVTIQPKILRALQEREIRPLGSIQTVNVDVRIIAATNQDLQIKINEKMFREDLYYRLNAMQIEIPPLKSRPEDIPVLVDHFLQRFRKNHNHNVHGVSQRALSLMLDYSWPGNIRELENVIERATLLCKGDTIMPEDLLFARDNVTQTTTAEWAGKKRPLEEVEKDYILEVLQSAGGNRSQAAHILGIGRKTLYNKLARYDIE